MQNHCVRKVRTGPAPGANTPAPRPEMLRACSLGAVLVLGLAGFTSSALAGTQSLVLAPGTHAVAIDPTQAATQSWRIEFQLHAWSPQTAYTTAASLWTMNGTGATAGLISNAGSVAQGETLRLTDARDLAVSPCNFSLINRSNVLVRVQRDAVNGRFVCEIWNGDGSGHDRASSNFAPSAVWAGSGGDFGSNATTAKIGFFRTFTTILSDAASAPALTTPEPTYTQLEFEGSMADSSSYHHDATLSGASYAATPVSRQSLSLTPGVVSSKVGDALYGVAQSLRFEFQMHGWSATTGTGTIWSLSSIGATAAIYQATNGVSWLRLVDARDTAASGTGVCDLSLASRTNVLVRVQRDATQNRFVCEIWNTDGTGYAKSSYSIVPVSKTFSGKGFGGVATTVKLAFARLFNTILADGSPIPALFVKDSTLNYWDFDGNVTDSSGGHHDITMASAAVYAPTLVVAQSVSVVSGNPAITLPDPSRPSTSSSRVEFQLNNWCATTGAGTLWHLAGLGLWASTYVSDSGIVILRTYDERDTMVTGASVNDIVLSGRTNVLVRVQRDAAKSRFVTEVWNIDGTGYASYASTFTANAWSGSGGSIGGGTTNATFGFFRVLDAIVPDGSTAPTTYTSEATATNLLLDGTLLDGSGYHHDASGTGAVFSPTPKQPPVSLLRTTGAPTWSTWVSLRAGFPAILDGTHSFSMDGTSNAVAYSWTATGPTPVTFSDPTAATPTVRGLVFGTYTFTLTVTDVVGQSTTSVLSVGAVATDNNGVVVQANPAADLIFGPMIAFGKNPWPWADQMALHSAQVRQPYLAAISPPGWGTNLSGTISYIPSSANSSSQTTLASAIGPTDMTITVTDASTMDFSALPALIMIHTPSVWTPVEQIRICGVAGNVLTVCYDGRAFMAGTYEQVPAPQSWSALSVVRQATTKGVGTKFLTDFCAAGPGEAGFVAYNTGTISPTPGSTMVTGTGTAWNGSYQSMRIRIQGTHHGVAFAFFSWVANVANGNSIMLGRPWPVDADAGSFSYAILKQSRYMVRGWQRPDLTVGNSLASISSCESDTRVYHGDIFSSVQGTQTNQTVRFQDASEDWFSEFGPNYYDEVLAHYAGYYRSGYSMFRDNARAVGDYLPTNPGFDEGWQGILPRRVGATGLVTAAVLDGTDDTGAANSRVNNWYAIRRLANQAISNPYSGGAIVAPCGSDVRESAYGLSWIALAAMFDPVDTGDPSTPNQRSYWKAQLALALARDKSCKGANNEFPAPSFNTGASFTLTNGSTTVTGSNVSPSMCPVTGTGTISVTSGLTFATGTGGGPLVPSTKIVVMGKRNGRPYLFFSLYSMNSPTGITMSTPYDGDTGTYPYQLEGDNYWLAFAATYTDATNMNTLYACQYLNSSTIKLDRPWTGTTGVYMSSRYSELGYGQQPFMLGIKTFAMKLASLGATGSTAADYATLASGAANWLMNTGFDPATGGLNYARGWGGCEPKINPRMNCTYATDPASRASARMLNAEAQNAMRVAYEANPTATNKDFGDKFYGAQWGKLGGPYSDDVYLNALDNDASWNYKWLGFTFGMGMAHQWPAVRLGGVQPAVITSKAVTLNFGSVANAASAKVTVLQPSSKKTVYSCSATSCPVVVDARQGEHPYMVQYYASTGTAVGSPVWGIITVP